MLDPEKFREQFREVAEAEQVFICPDHDEEMVFIVPDQEVGWMLLACPHGACPIRCRVVARTATEVETC